MIRDIIQAKLMPLWKGLNKLYTLSLIPLTIYKGRPLTVGEWIYWVPACLIRLVDPLINQLVT